MKIEIGKILFWKGHIWIFGSSEEVDLTILYVHQCEGQEVCIACSTVPWTLLTSVFMWSEYIIRLAVIKLKML